jgi:hypothetical protein
MRQICSIITSSARGLNAEKGTYFLLDVIDDEEKDKFIFDFKVFNSTGEKSIGTYNIERNNKKAAIEELKLGSPKKIFWFTPDFDMEQQMAHYYNWLKETLEKGF